MSAIITSGELDRIGLSRTHRQRALACCLIQVRRGLYIVRPGCGSRSHAVLQAHARMEPDLEVLGAGACAVAERAGVRGDDGAAVAAWTGALGSGGAPVGIEAAHVDVSDIDLPGLRGHAARLSILARSYAGALPDGCGLSHQSAALLWGLPLTRTNQSKVEAIMRGKSLATEKRIIRRRAVDDSDFVIIDGIRVTTVARTLLDVALDHPMDVSVPMIDHALRSGLIDAGAVIGLADGIRGRRGAKQARWALALADPARESPAESICAVRFHEHGIEGFEPQISFRIDADGTIARVDFFHRAAQVVVEVNGEIKYSDGDPGAARARQERQREFGLRNLGHHVFQLGWPDLFRPGVFRHIAHVVSARSPG